MDQTRRQYPSDLTDWQWEIIKEYIPVARSGGRRRTTDIRKVIDAIFYLNRTGSPWRYLPKEFPPWQTVYDYFAQWNKAGTWHFINRILSQAIRIRKNRNELPSLAIVDAQSVRSSYGEDRGYDAIKKVRGRKRNILVDSLGLLLSCEVHSAKEIDAKGGLMALEKMPEAIRKHLTKILGDTVYKWPFNFYSETTFNIPVEIIDRRKDPKLSNLKPKRWIVERTFAWFNHYRRLSRDYERKTINSESMIYISMIAIMLNRLSG